MKIVIIGDGRVAFKVAKQLSEENYDIVLIDNNAEKLQEAINNLDIICVKGNGASAEVQIEAGVPDAELVIACASKDEHNMLCSLLAKELGAKNTIARVRNPIYYQQIDMLKKALHLSMVVNPELAVANEIARVLILPDANKIELFMKGRIELVQFSVKEGNTLVGCKLADIYKNNQIQILVCAIQRGQKVYIPNGDFQIEQGDKLHIAATHMNIERFFAKMGNRKTTVKNVLICGGGRVGYYLAKQLSSIGMKVKIIENQLDKCEDLCEQLPKVTVIHGDATDHDLLMEEGIRDADAMVSLTNLDEENIIMSLFGKKQGVSKIVAKVNEDSRAQMVDGLGIDSIVSTKTATADNIMSYVRARQNSFTSSDIEAMYRLVDDRVEALEFIVRENKKYTNIPLKDLKTRDDVLIACIGRNRQTIIPHGNDCIMPGDSMVVIAKAKKIQKFTDIFE